MKVIVKGVEFDVEYDYEPGEPQTYDHPGCGSDADLTEVFIGEYDVLPVISQETYELIVEKVCEAEADMRAEAAYDL